MFSFLISVYCVVANIYCYIIVSCGLLLFVFLMFIELSYSCVMFVFLVGPVSDPNDVLVNDPVLKTLVDVVHSNLGTRAV